MRRSIPIGVLLCCAMLSTQGCKSRPGWCQPGGPIAPGCGQPHILDLTVSPTQATINPGQTLRLTAAITNNTSNLAFVLAWSSSDSTKATVDSSGLVTGRSASPGVAICATATKVDYGGMQACATVVVSPPPSNPGPTTAMARRRQRDDAP